MKMEGVPNGKLLNIVFVGGCFGNFLKYFLEKFSDKTPPLEGDPFNDIGTSHSISTRDYSGLIRKYHLDFIQKNKKHSDLPVCLILPNLDETSILSRKHDVFLKQARLYRVEDRRWKPDHLWQRAIGEMTDELRIYAENIVKLYNIEKTSHFTWLPKFLVRDWYKLAFLEGPDIGMLSKVRDHVFFKKQDTYQFPLEAFFHWSQFLDEVTNLDKRFNLELDFSRVNDMKRIFMRGLNKDSLRQEANLATEIITNGLDTEFKDFDVSTEAWIYAEMEQQNEFVQMPLANRFFRDTAELEQFLEHYPEQYRAMNPNMPKFRGYPNPYYLKK